MCGTLESNESISSLYEKLARYHRVSIVLTIAFFVLLVSLLVVGWISFPRLQWLFILTAIGGTLFIIAEWKPEPKSRYWDKQIEIHLTGINKIQDGGFKILVRTTKRAYALNEISVLAPPENGEATAKAYWWYIDYLKKHPECVKHQTDSVVVSSRSLYDNCDNRPDWKTLNHIANQAYAELTSQEIE